MSLTVNNIDDDFINEWATNKKKEKKQSEQPYNFRLTEYSHGEDGCNYCLQSKCNVHNGEKAKCIPSTIKKIVRNPSILLGDIKDILKENGLDVGEKHIHVNTCVWNYTHSQCQNCADGRSKIIQFTDSKDRKHDLKFCMPILKNNSNVIPIGFHWDLDLTIQKDELIDYQIYPYDGKKDDKQKDLPKSSSNQNFVHTDEDTFPNLSENTVVSPSNNNIWGPKTKNKITSDEKSSDSNNDDENMIISKLKDEINVLLKENNDQKDAIKGLKTMISLDSKENNSSSNEENENLKDVNTSLESTIKKLKSKIFHLEKENKTLMSEKTPMLSDKQIKNIENATKHYSNVMFESLMRTHYE